MMTHRFKVILLPIYAVLLLSQNGGINGDPMSAITLTDQALKFGTPFLQSASSKLYSNIFGSGRAARSTDVVIMNHTDETFMLQSSSTASGGWTSDMLPYDTIPPRSAVVYGVESGGFMTGASDCRLEYVSYEHPNKGFTVSTSNPYWTTNSARGHGVGGIRVTHVSGKGHHNIVRFKIF